MSHRNGAFLLPARRSKADRTVRYAMGDLLAELRNGFGRTADVCAGPLRPSDSRCLWIALTMSGGAIQSVHSLLAAGDLSPGGAITTLRKLQEDASDRLREAPPDAYLARGVLAWLVGRLNLTEAAVAKVVDQPQATRFQVAVSTDLLYQLHQSLFPAERMFVIAGRREGSITKLSAPFDVTGQFSGASVRADPDRLAQALIAMDHTQTYLAAWVHSHPGSGAGSTRPSHIDLNQQQDWIRDYTPDLLSVIFVEDRWLRFWGPAFESKRIRLNLIGSGVTKEDTSDNLYRLTR